MHNWIHEETREFKFQHIEEPCRKCDLDGIELYLMRHSSFFKVEETTFGLQHWGGNTNCPQRKVKGGTETPDLHTLARMSQYQADRSDNTASRACRFEVSAEHHRRNRPNLAEPHNSLLSN